MDEGSGGVKVSGQFGKDGGVYFNKTVNDAYQTRKEIDRNVYEQHEGSVITTFKPWFLKGLENGEYDFIQTNGDELAGAALTVADGQITMIDGIFSGLERAQAAYDAGHPEEVDKFDITDGEYLFYLGAAEHVMTGTVAVPVIDGCEQLALGANSYPVVQPFSAVYDQRTSSADHQEVAVIKYDNGHTFDADNPISLFGKPVPAMENVQVSVYNEQTKQMEVSEIERTNYTISDDKITFTTDYLDSLGEGPHDFQINYTDGVPAALLEINVTTSAQPVNSGGGGITTYPPTIIESKHGKVAVDPTKPKSGDTVTITVTPDEGYELDALTVEDSNGKEITVTKNADGTYSYKQPTGKVTITATFKETKPASPKRPFTDVSESDWFYEAVYHCYDNGYFQGVSDTTFDPQGTMTRAMFATVLHRVAGEPEVTGENPFTDVEEGTWYTDAVIWAAGEKIIEGYGNGKFGTNDPVTREQMVTLLWRYHGKPVVDGVDLSGFTDADKISDWARDAFAWAVSTGVIQGKGGGILDPMATATQAEVAQIVMNYDTKVK